MTAQLIDLAEDQRLAETVGDAALASLLRTKPDEEGIPASVWWLVAETLRSSVAIRRVLSGVPDPDGEDLDTLVAEAGLLTDAALAELAETTAARPTPIALASRGDRSPDRSRTRPVFGLQLSVLFLARLLVTQRLTTPQRLANTLAAHRRALAALGT